MTRRFALALLAALLLPAAAAGELFTHLAPRNVAADMFRSPNGTAPDPVQATSGGTAGAARTQNNGGPYLISWNSVHDSSHEDHFLETGGYGYNANKVKTEENSGYLAARFRLLVDYHVYDPAGVGFDANNALGIAYTLGGTNADKNWISDQGWLSPPLPVTGAAVDPDNGTWSNDVVMVYDLPAAVTDHYKSWKILTRSNSTDESMPGIDFRFFWFHKAGLCMPNGRVYIDAVRLLYSCKLVMYYNPSALFSGTTVTEGSRKVPVGAIRMRRGGNNSIKINAIKATLEGGGLTPADVDAVHFVRETTKDAKYSSGEPIVTVNNPASLTDITFSGSPLVNAVANNSWYLVCVDVDENACQATNPKYVGLHIPDESKVTLAGTVDVVLSEEDRDEPTVVDSIVPQDIWPIRTGADDAGRVRIIPKASVSAAVSLPPDDDPLTVTMGDSFTIRVTLTNAADVGVAENVFPELPLVVHPVDGAPVIEYVSGAATPVTLDPEESAWWDFTYQATMNGTLEVTARASFRDKGNGKSYLGAFSDPSERIEVLPLPAPYLQMTSMTLTPAAIPDTGTMTLAVKVTNIGTLVATNVTLHHPVTHAAFEMQEFGDAEGTLGPASDGARNIAAGANFIWTYTFTPDPGKFGQKWYGCYAKADDAPDPRPGTSGVGEVVEPGDLVCGAGDYYTTPAGVSPFDSTFTLTLKVANAGGATMNNVVPAVPSITKSAGAGNDPQPLPAIQSGPVPASASVASGASVEFNWIIASNCTTNLGFVDIGNGYASGVDAALGTADGTGTTLSVELYQINDDLGPRWSQGTGAAVRVPVTYGYDAGDQTVYYALDEAATLHAYTAAGGKKWDPPLALGSAPYNQTANASHLLNLWVDYVGADLVIFVGTAGGRVYGILDAGDAPAPLWTGDIATSYYAIAGGPAVHGIVGYSQPPDYDLDLLITAGQRVVRLRAADRSLVWNINAGVAVKSTACVDNSLVYVGCGDSTIRSFAWDDEGNEVNETDPFGPAGADQGQVTSPFPLGKALYASNAKGMICKVGDAMTLDDPAELMIAPAGTRTLADVWLSIDGGTLWTTRVGDPGANMNRLYKIDVSGGTPVWASGWTDGKDFASAYGPTPNALSPPIEYDGSVYVTSYDSAGAQKGRVWILDASDGARLSDSWPYPCDGVGSRFQAPVALDLESRVFLLGNDEGSVYAFSIP